jgi:hypothetical protein
MVTSQHNTLGYAPAPSRRRRFPRAVVWALGLWAAIVVLLVVLPFCGQAYTAGRYKGLRPGMTRAQADRRLWAYAASAVRYQGAPPGSVVIRYNLLWFGKMAAIQIIYDSNGKALDVQPIFEM